MKECGLFLDGIRKVIRQGAGCSYEKANVALARLGEDANLIGGREPGTSLQAGVGRPS